MNFRRSFLGRQSKNKGRITESQFERILLYQNILSYKIHDPNYKNNKVKNCVLGSRQLCDYILFLSDTLPVLCDLKTGKKPTFSKFKNQKIDDCLKGRAAERLMTPTQAQFYRFKQMEKMGFFRTGFFFIPETQIARHQSLSLFFIPTAKITPKNPVPLLKIFAIDRDLRNILRKTPGRE